MSFDTVKSNLEKEGKDLLGKLRSLLNDELTDQFRSCLSESLFDDVRKYKDDLVIAESVALHEQKPSNETCIWFQDYEKYIKLKEIISDHKKENFKEFEDELEDFDDEFEEMKVQIVVDCPSGNVKPSLKSIVRIFELVDIDMEIDEDLYFDIKHFFRSIQSLSRFNGCKRRLNIKEPPKRWVVYKIVIIIFYLI